MSIFHQHSLAALKNCLNVIYKLAHELRSPRRKKCPYSEFFWFVFSCIRPEYGDSQSKFRSQSECGNIRTRKTPNMDTFYAVVRDTFHAVHCGERYGLWQYATGLISLPSHN